MAYRAMLQARTSRLIFSSRREDTGNIGGASRNENLSLKTELRKSARRDGIERSSGPLRIMIIIRCRSSIRRASDARIHGLVNANASRVPTG